MNQKETAGKIILTSRQPKILDKVARLQDTLSVHVYGDVVKALQQRLRHECARVKAIGNDMDKLAASFNHYQDLREERTKREERIKRLYALLAPDGLPIVDDEEYLIVQGGVDNPECSLSLWEVLREYLSVVGESQILDAAGMVERFWSEPVSRQAIESAVKRHPEVFRVRMSGGKKLISLK